MIHINFGNIILYFEDFINLDNPDTLFDELRKFLGIGITYKPTIINE